MFSESDLSDYVFIKNRRKVVPALVALTEGTDTRGNHVLWDLWKKMVSQNLNASLQNGTQVEFGKFVDGVNAMIAGKFATKDELSARLERALQHE